MREEIIKISKITNGFLVSYEDIVTFPDHHRGVTHVQTFCQDECEVEHRVQEVLNNYEEVEKFKYTSYPQKGSVVAGLPPKACAKSGSCRKRKPAKATK
jgi:hypothetical protein